MIFFTACSNNDESLKDEKSSKRIENVLSEKDITTQKTKYLMLSKNDKYILWKNKIAYLIENSGLTPEQIFLLRELKSQIKPSLFDSNIDNNNEKEIFNNVYAKNFLDRAKLIFDEKFVASNFFEISTHPNNYNKTEFTNEGDTSCQCKIGSVWSCLAGTWECKPNDCKGDTDGCGFLGLSECNGICK